MQDMPQAQEAFLLIENNEDDIVLMRRSFLKVGSPGTELEFAL